MGFHVRWKDAPTGEYTEKELTPWPTTVEYPPRRTYNLHTSKDGVTVVQRPIRDARPRKWLWDVLRKDSATFASLWAVLDVLEWRNRVKAEKYPYIEIWEDVTGIGGFDRWTEEENPEDRQKIWTRAKVLDLDRIIRPNGGPVIYAPVTMTFVVEDPTYQEF
jgi:hypothetical protein